MPGPPKLPIPDPRDTPISIAGALAYLKTKGYDFSRMTVYNWTQTGRAGYRLETIRDRKGRRTTTRRNVDEFLTLVGL